MGPFVFMWMEFQRAQSFTFMEYLAVNMALITARPSSFTGLFHYVPTLLLSYVTLHRHAQAQTFLNMHIANKWTHKLRHKHTWANRTGTHRLTQTNTHTHRLESHVIYSSLA